MEHNIMASHDNATSENPGSEKESTRPSSMGLKRKAADIFDDKQVWVLPGKIPGHNDGSHSLMVWRQIIPSDRWQSRAHSLSVIAL